MNSKKTSAPPNRLIGGNQAEHSVNCALGEELEARHPGWQERVWVERTRVIEDNLRLRPDIIVRHPGGLPVVLENEFAPAVKVEEEAISRLGKKLKDTGEDIEQAIALKTPLRIKDSGNLRRALSISRDFEICVLSGDAKNPQRWPEKGWLVVDVDGLAEAIELASLSENRIERSMEILDFAVSQTASILMEASQEAPESLLSIAEELHQESGEQTARMAMAIITNALTFHRAIEKSEGIKTIEELKDKEADVAPGKISDAWRHIYEEINYQPIFKTAASLLKHIPDATARTVLKNLVAVSSKLNALGITSQHDLNGRMFQRLIRDRKFLATFYTLPSSAALLSEVAVSRLGMDWSNDKDICGMRVADFACGTGALLGAAYGSAMSRYRRGGGGR